MAVQYRHTQPAHVMFVGIGLAVVLNAVLGIWIVISTPGVWWPVGPMTIGIFAALALLAWYFSAMTVTVTEDEVRWHFGPGRDWRIARADIDSVSIVPHSVLVGYGIRWYGPKRWVYAVSGRRTVELRLKQGGWRRLGTDDPEGLLKALREPA
jgi:hypothetical protein